MGGSFPRGRIERIYLHWSGWDYVTVHPSYHYCVALRDGAVEVEHTGDLTSNMRDLRGGEFDDYVAHTRGRNSFAAGLSVMGMRDARPDDFGEFPITAAQIDALCVLAAEIARAYAIPIDADHVLTHAEAAIVDGYFGSGEEERWDIARLQPRHDPLTEDDAHETGSALRRFIRSHVVT